MKSVRERNSSKRGVFLFSLTLAEYGAKGEGRIIGALKSPMMIIIVVSQEIKGNLIRRVR